MITNEQGDFTPLLFVHIPKTAGIALRQTLGKDNWVRTWYVGHDPYHVLKQNNIIPENTFKFSVVRNPFTRTYSYYNHFCRINNCNISFKKFLHMVESNYVTKTNPMLRYDQSFYIYYGGKCEMNKLYRFENLSELEKDLDIHLLKINVGSYSKEEYYKDYDPESIDRVRKVCAKDFYNLGYSDEFS